ncbi:arylamine N-acetyltransferase family protein [Streptomyces sp. NPDC001222]|uniref:arylamine N-acetyltransferase family protein n=1 Tax=Streptomyces sp. NPDC001222 TaxID=3364548 RepID=UPI0036B65C3E
MDSAQVDAYVDRIGSDRPAWPTIEVLRELHLRHLLTVPFENLSIHLGEEIVLEEKRLIDKIVGARRGGFCYELNGAFAALLTALGFDVTLLAGRVHGEKGRLGVPYDHLALRVRTVDGGDWLADVGFGAHSHFPLEIAARGEQRDPGGVFRVIEATVDAAGVRGGGGSAESSDLDVLRDGTPQYRLEMRPRVLEDFVTGAWWNTTSPASHFVRSLVCSRVTEDGGRITLSGRRLTVTAPGGRREVSDLASDGEALEVYRETFGIVLDRVPTVRQVRRND